MYSNIRSYSIDRITLDKSSLNLKYFWQETVKNT